MFSNWESGLLQDGCGGPYRILCFLQDSPIGFLHDVYELDFWGWMVDGRCMDGYGGRMGVWSDLGTDGWSDEMICGKLTWLESSWDNNGEEGKVTWQKRRWEMREQTWWWRSWSEWGSNEWGGDEDSLHSGYLIKPTTSCMQSKYHVIYLTS